MRPLLLALAAWILMLSTLGCGSSEPPPIDHEKAVIEAKQIQDLRKKEGRTAK
jgi:hypothetical protein